MAVWNLEDIYQFKQTEKLIEELKEKAQEFSKSRDKLDNIGVKEFLKLVRQKEEIAESAAKVASYAMLWQTEDTTDSKRNAHQAKISEILARLSNDMLFFGIWFKDLDEKKAKNFIEASGKYKYMLQRIRDYKPYTLSEKEEKIINLKDLSGTEASVRIYDIITNKFLFDWKGKKLNQEQINVYKQSSKREERKKSYDLVLSKFGEEEQALGEIYKSIVNDWRNESISIRGYKTPISVQNIANDIPDETVEAMLKVVRRNKQVFQEYFKLKANILGIKLDRYDILAPLKESKKEYSYEESKRIVLEVIGEFSNDAKNMAKEVFEKKHVHSDVKPGKRSGAYCTSTTRDIGPYVMLNHMNKMNDLFTMAHEMGHAVHFIASKEQSEFTYHAALPLAETASIFNEMLLAQKLLKEAGKEEKKGLLMRMLEGQYASITRQAYFVMFEEKAHAMIAEGATVEELNKEYLSNLKEQFGNIPIPEVFRHEWKYIPHIYFSPFYCYAYAFGNLLVLALYKMYEEEGKAFVPKYMKILSYGGNMAPGDILAEAGIDINSEKFWQKGFEIIKREIEELRGLA